MIREDGILTLQESLQKLGPLYNSPFIVRFLFESECVNCVNTRKWEACDCNHRVVAWL